MGQGQSAKRKLTLLESIQQKSYFNLFFIDIPNILTPPNTGQKGGAYNPSKSVEEESNITRLTNDGSINENEQNKLLLWKSANEIYEELFKNKKYPELSYQNRMTNLKSYIIVVIIRKVFRNATSTGSNSTGSNSTGSKNFDLDKLTKNFKRIGLYIYFKLYQILHYHGNIQFKYFANNLVPEKALDDNEQLIKDITQLIKDFESHINTNTQIKDALTNLFDITFDEASSEKDVQILNIIKSIEKRTNFRTVIATEDTYFFNAFIELTLTQIIYKYIDMDSKKL